MAKIDFEGSDPLGRGGAMTSADMRRFCHNANLSNAARGNGWWYYVQRDKLTGHNSVQKLEGDLGEEVQKYSRGWRPDFSGWSEYNLGKYEAKLRSLFNHGYLDEQEPML